MKIIKYIITFFLFFSSAIYAYEAPDTFLKNSVQEVSAFITQNKEVLENLQNPKSNRSIKPGFTYNKSEVNISPNMGYDTPRGFKEKESLKED